MIHTDIGALASMNVGRLELCDQLIKLRICVWWCGTLDSLFCCVGPADPVPGGAGIDHINQLCSILFTSEQPWKSVMHSMCVHACVSM